MKYFVNFVVLIFVVFLCNSSAKSNEKFPNIDIDKIMRQSKAGKSINKHLESLLSQTTKKYKEIENNLCTDQMPYMPAFDRCQNRNFRMTIDVDLIDCIPCSAGRHYQSATRITIIFGHF